MARTKTFSLGETYDGILADLVRSGRFGTETEAVQAGIRMLADYELNLRSLRQEISAADAEDHHAIGVGAKIDAPAAIGKAAQTFENVVAGRPGKTYFGDPCDLGGEV